MDDLGLPSGVTLLFVAPPKQPFADFTAEQKRYSDASGSVPSFAALALLLTLPL